MGPNNLKENSQLRSMARQQLQGNWGMPLLVCFLTSIIIGAPNAIPFIGAIGTLILTGPLTFGQSRYFVKFERGENPDLETLFDGFKQFGQTFLLGFLMGIFIFLWSLLLIVPGIIAAISYSQAYYILIDNPGMEAMEALRRSKEMMSGYKGKYFLLCLSFIGWGLLCILTFGIGFLWLSPYMQLSYVHFYEDLKYNSYTQPTYEGNTMQ